MGEMEGRRRRDGEEKVGDMKEGISDVEENE